MHVSRWIAAVLFLAGCAPGANRPAGMVTGQPTPIAFACPAPGTQTVTTTASRVTNATWDGADVSDPTVCLTTNTAGRTQRILYGYYPLPLSSESDIRSAFTKAFSGAASDECFNVTGSSMASVAGNNNYTYRRCLRQVGPTTVEGNKLVLFELTDRGMAGNTFSGVWSIYYDPATHLFTRADLAVDSGSASGGWKRSIVSKL